MIFEDNKGIMVLSIAVVTTLAITGIFMYAKRPTAMIIARGGEKKIELVHKGGNDLYWRELRISVTSGRNSKPVFENPTDGKYPLGSENKSLAEIYNVFSKGMTVNIYRTTQGKILVEENEYHLKIEHKPSNLILMDMNARVKRVFRGA
ncbi:hypothetical protein AKJ51_02315 [candidate division MSBL1 archaeon SCGC-AAA382A20]|uniref:Archaeal Type IV pilin N-terminal domain-containing protein n=1 Tax=candidate division MSBL1 archaeon SCGC-AAA382A20 TaxID=1698280 RepID=A0A133VKM3_9EURY|nr:hypothetical protein AKJ51_02315 [candidate division MSBL1 archaeon SCGC-AAA382A20]